MFFFGMALAGSEQVLHSDRFHAALGRQLLFTGTILIIEIPLGVAIALAMPREGPWVSVCLVLMALPLLIPLERGRRDVEYFRAAGHRVFGICAERPGLQLQHDSRPDCSLVYRHHHGCLALDVACRPACLCRADLDSRCLLPGGQNRWGAPLGRFSDTFNCRR